MMEISVYIDPPLGGSIFLTLTPSISFNARSLKYTASLPTV
ncbi:MAG: hypothetical protein QW803_11900 [Candidatus Methanomethylicia archaeon]